MVTTEGLPMPRAATAITIPLQGGLGNQLFELAAGIVVRSRFPRRVHYSDYWLTNPVDGETPRAFALEGLLRRDELVSAPTPRVGRVSDRLMNHRVIERSPDDDALARVGRLTHVLAGYFQRLSYVEEAWPELRARFLNSPNPAHRRLVSPQAGDHGAIHYRLGDYVSNTGANAHHGVTSPDYFVDVIRDGHKRLGITDWRVVSDDTSTALDLLASRGLPSNVALSAAEDGNEWEDLSTLASARACAISNSSFSWWAAFVGASSRPTEVVAPRPWFANAAASEPPLFPDKWLRRDRPLL
ncbi:alpha-1,2-fucosyltransferase [Nocardioides iriomotensis]|nr:alpha-1,2-fucosyltransferase [Nocardioides iriomotensis]